MQHSRAVLLCAELPPPPHTHFWNMFTNNLYNFEQSSHAQSQSKLLKRLCYWTSNVPCEPGLVYKKGKKMYFIEDSVFFSHSLSAPRDLMCFSLWHIAWVALLKDEHQKGRNRQQTGCDIWQFCRPNFSPSYINYYTTQIYNIMIVVTSTINNKRESI